MVRRPASMPSLRERKKADTRSRLAVAAVELLVSEGAEGATVSAIAGRAGVSTRTFHNYFPHREDALVHFLREQVNEWVEQVEQAPDGMSPLGVLRSIFGELHTRSGDDVSAAENLLMVGEQIGLLLGSEARAHAESILDPLYEAVQRRAPPLEPVPGPGVGGPGPGGGGVGDPPRPVSGGDGRG